MELGEKIRHLREVEGNIRGLGRPMTKAEVVRAMRDELGVTPLSHAYLSQIESGVRVHLTEKTRDLLARFFKVHPGYLVSDPPDWDLTCAPVVVEGADRLKAWLLAQAEQLADEPQLAHLLLRLSRQPDPRRYLWLFDQLLDVSPAEAEQWLAAAVAARRGDGQRSGPNAAPGD